MQAMMFPEGMYYDCEMKGYRTTRVNGFFVFSSQLQELLAVKEKGRNNHNDCFSLLVVRRGIEPLLPE
jgi:site-specific DNA recombinase